MVMSDPTETPDKYLATDLFGQSTGINYNEVQDLTVDPTGATWNVNGYYAGSQPNYALESTAQFQISSFQLTGATATAGACGLLAHLPPNIPIKQATQPAPGAVPCSTLANSPTAISGMCCPPGATYDATGNICTVQSGFNYNPPVKGKQQPTCPPGQVLNPTTGQCQGPTPTATPTSNTGTYMLVGLGVLGAGTALYYALR